jgi:hypothetical protein
VDPTYASFGDYLRTAATYKCSEDRSTIQGPMGVVPKIRSYAMNSYVGLAKSLVYQQPGYRSFKKSGDLASAGPSRMFLFSDVLPENLCYPAFIVPMPESGTDFFFHYPLSLHRNRGVLTFTDGHAEGHRWVDARTCLRPPANSLVAHANFSPNNPDLTWLREHTTIKN